MDDPARLTTDFAPTYRCPGEAHPIDRSVHIARLATFYPACLECTHRHDTQGLTTRQLRERAHVERRASAGPQWESEGLVGRRPADISIDVVERFAAAVAACAWQDASGTAVPTILVGSDGSWTTADFLTAACRAVQLAACRAVEIGAVTTPALSLAATKTQASAAIWIGGTSGEPGQLEIRSWQAAGQPASAPGVLDAVRQLYDAPATRSRRTGGGLSRATADADYLSTLASAYHGLRPLALVVDTTCEVLVRYGRSLTAQSACQILRPRVSALGPACEDESRQHVTRRLALLGQEVPSQGAHLGAWIDGAGEACHLVDERGRPVPPRQLAATLGTLVRRKHAAREIVVSLSDTRQAICARLSTAGTAYAADGSGRNWFGGSAVPDALATLTLVLALLSESDRPLSEVLDATPVTE